MPRSAETLEPGGGDSDGAGGTSELWDSEPGGLRVYKGEYRGLNFKKIPIRFWGSLF